MIICAIDQSTSRAVVTTAAELATAVDARLLLLHVAPDPPLFHSKAERERERNRAHTSGVALLRRAAKDFPAGLDWDSRVELGDAVGEIRAAAQEHDASLLVVGSRGRGLVASTLLGSVSNTLARRAPCPVAIVPRDARGNAIVVGVGESERSRGAAALATELAAALAGRLILVPGPEGDVPTAHVLQRVAVHEGAGLVVVGTDGVRETRQAA
jgi:nucleotide-binding universal stress UspA family protein